MSAITKTCNMYQNICKENNFKYPCDAVIVSFYKPVLSGLYLSSPIPPLTQAADHDIVFIDVNTRASIPKQTPATKFLYKKADWASMRQEMSNYVLPTTSVQEQWNDMENFLKSLMNKFIPTKVFRPQKHKP